MATKGAAKSSNVGVVVSLSVNCLEVIGLGLTAWVTGSTAIKAQTAANAAEVAVTVFLLIGVLSSVRGPDDSHPLGYGRDRFFWSLFAALGLFAGGGGLALGEAVQSLLHPTGVHSYLLAYLVLGATAALDASAMIVGLRPLRAQAVERGFTSREYLRRTTDPAGATVVIGGGCAVIGAAIAALGLGVTQLSGSPMADAIASAAIGLLLLAASFTLLRTNRELLTGRGVGPALLAAMRQVIAQQPGITDVPDLFAVVVGPLSLVVDGDITFVHGLDVADVESAIANAASELRKRWPMIQYIYLTPVSAKRPRGAARSAVQKNMTNASS
jgi:cation diffusion facilitator family transporter